MSQNPYAPPSSDLNISTSIAHIYSPRQVAVGVLIGGPVAVFYFIRSNCVSINNKKLVKSATLYGSIFVAAAILVYLKIPKDFPGLPINIAYMLAAGFVANRIEVNHHKFSNGVGFGRHSYWRVFGCGLLCALVSISLVLAATILS